jgi:hypothetical protein
MKRGRRVVVAGLGNWLQVLTFRLLAPFMTTDLLNLVGSYVMGRA